MSRYLAAINECLAGIGGLGSLQDASVEDGVLRVRVRRGRGAGCPGYLDDALEQVARERLGQLLQREVQVEIVG